MSYRFHGIIDDNGYVLNDITSETLVKQALSHAAAGAAHPGAAAGRRRAEATGVAEQRRSAADPDGRARRVLALHRHGRPADLLPVH